MSCVRHLPESSLAQHNVAITVMTNISRGWMPGISSNYAHIKPSLKFFPLRKLLFKLRLPHPHQWISIKEGHLSRPSNAAPTPPSHNLRPE